MILDDLDKGDRRDVHLTLAEADLAILDGVVRRYRTSRAQVVAAWAKRYAEEDLAARVTEVKLRGGSPINRKGT